MLKMVEREINIVIEILGRMSTKSKTFKKILEIHNSQNCRLDTFNRVKKSRKSSSNLERLDLILDLFIQ
jgi:hypothetical protein